MKEITIILTVLVLLLYIKWIIILLIFPIHVVHNQVRKKWNTKDEMPFFAQILIGPYVIWENLLHYGWERFMLYQVGTIPSNHLRKLIYKMLGGKGAYPLTVIIDQNGVIAHVKQGAMSESELLLEIEELLK